MIDGDGLATGNSKDAEVVFLSIRCYEKTFLKHFRTIRLSISMMVEPEIGLLKLQHAATANTCLDAYIIIVSVILSSEIEILTSSSA